MKDTQQTVLLSDIKQQTLAQWLPYNITPIGLLINHNKNQENFELSIPDNTSAPESTAIELVVFSDISVEKLTKLLTSCHITHCQLQAINHRNNATSYRFNVHVANIKTAREQLATFTSSENIEAALLCNPPTLSQPGLLVMDMDSTTIKIECIDEIAALAGVGKEVAEVTELAMQGKLDFSESLYQRVGKLAGSPESILANVASNLPLMEGLETLITELKKHHWRIAIASGGFTYFADHLKTKLALDAAIANTLEINDKTLTGKVLGDVIDAQAKADCLSTLQANFNIDATQTVAMGDGANDLVMMAAAHLGVAFHAKPLVLAQADSCITSKGLDCLLHWLA